MPADEITVELWMRSTGGWRACLAEMRGRAWGPGRGVAPQRAQPLPLRVPGQKSGPGPCLCAFPVATLFLASRPVPPGRRHLSHGRPLFVCCARQRLHQEWWAGGPAGWSCLRLMLQKPCPPTMPPQPALCASLACGLHPPLAFFWRCSPVMLKSTQNADSLSHGCRPPTRPVCPRRQRLPAVQLQQLWWGGQGGRWSNNAGRQGTGWPTVFFAVDAVCLQGTELAAP